MWEEPKGVVRNHLSGDPTELTQLTFFKPKSSSERWRVGGFPWASMGSECEGCAGGQLIFSFWANMRRHDIL